MPESLFSSAAVLLAYSEVPTKLSGSFAFIFIKVISFSYSNERSKHNNLWLFKSEANGLVTSEMNSSNKPNVNYSTL